MPILTTVTPLRLPPHICARSWCLQCRMLREAPSGSVTLLRLLLFVPIPLHVFFCINAYAFMHSHLRAPRSAVMTITLTGIIDNKCQFVEIRLN